MPNEEELGRACTMLDLDDVSAAELLQPHARPVLSLDGPTAYLVLRTARYDDRQENISLGEMLRQGVRHNDLDIVRRNNRWGEPPPRRH